MLNENKIKMMTKMAIYEKNEGRQMIKNSRYFKGGLCSVWCTPYINCNNICIYNHGDTVCVMQP